MNILLFGASGMVGQGVLRECLNDPAVQLVKSMVRTSTGVQHPKLREIVHKDLWNYAVLASDLKEIDACFFCLGVSAAGMSEEDYAKVNYGIPVAAGEALSKASPKAVFIYVSGTGTDSSEKGRIMWARVKGRTENALLRLPFKGAYMFRPGIIRPMHGVKSRTTWYRVFYAIAGPLFPVFSILFPKQLTTTERVGLAMIRVAKVGFAKQLLESPDINAAAAETGTRAS